LQGRIVVVEFIRNAWYAVAYSTEVGATPFARKIFSKQVVVFRTGDGAPAVLDNRCPHKSAPLSMGALVDGTIECPYHGLRYDTAGVCVHIPGQPQIPAAARVRSYPTLERYGLIWIWPGDPALADASAIPQFRHFDEPGWTTFHGPYLTFPSGIGNIVENLVDPAHTTFVHARTIGGKDAADVPLTTEQSGDTITTGRWIENSEPVPVMKKYGPFRGKVDRWQQYQFAVPNVSLVDMGAIDAGAERSEQNRDRQYRTFSYATLTPETDRSTHYFWMVIRNFAIGDAVVSGEMTTAYVATFDEDRDLLREIQTLQDEGEARPLSLAIDAATVRLRRQLERRIGVERSGAALQPSG
jgi:vanillate O-demethylase monooxygenase subunit